MQVQACWSRSNSPIDPRGHRQLQLGERRVQIFDDCRAALSRIGNFTFATPRFSATCIAVSSIRFARVRARLRAVGRRSLRGRMAELRSRLDML